MKKKCPKSLKKVLAVTMAAVLLISCLAACASTADQPANPNFHKDAAELMDQWIYVDKTTVLSAMGVDQGTEVEVEPCYALENVLYCANPEDEECAVLSIYVPEAYVKEAVENSDGTYTLTFDKDVVLTNDVGTEYTVNTAPIIYQNSVDGYKEGYQLTLGTDTKGVYSNIACDGVSHYGDYVAAGYIFVSVSSRGVDSNLPVSDNPMAGAMGTGGQGRELESQGAAPSQIVDLKAGVRYLKYNDKILPGSSDKIIAIGGSAGGSLAALLGVSGNSKLYDSYLKEIGAIMKSSDDIYGVRAQAPIANVELADMAYEYLHSSETSYSVGMGSSMVSVDMTEPGSEFYMDLHNLLIKDFEAYIEELGLDAATFREGYLAAVNKALDEYVNYGLAFNAEGLLKESNVSSVSYDDVQGFVDEHDSLAYAGGKVTATSMEAFVADFMARSKALMGFDTEAAKSWETKMFGGVADGEAYGEHFSAPLLAALKELSDKYPEAARLVEVYDNAENGVNSEGKQDVVKLMSCMTFLSGDEKSDIAQHWRLGNSTMDGDVGSIMAYLMTRVMTDKLGIEDAQFFLGVDEISGSGHGFCDFNFLDVEAYIDEMCTGKSVEKPALPELPLVTYEPSSGGGPNGGAGGGPNGGGTGGGPDGGADDDDNGPDGDNKGPDGDADGPEDDTAGDATYTYADDFPWTLVLKADGTYSLTEANPFFGSKTYTGTYTQDGNSVAIGPMTPAPGMFKWANPAGFTVTLDGETFTPNT